MVRDNHSQRSGAFLGKSLGDSFLEGRLCFAMERRDFLRRVFFGSTACPLLSSQSLKSTPLDGTVAPLHAGMGMPGPFPGRVVEVKSPSAIVLNHVNSSVVQEMIALGMTKLTGASTVLKAWQTLFNSQDIVGIKINASGVPGCVSSPEIVNKIIRWLNEVGIPPQNIFLYERFPDQIDMAGYHAYVPNRVNIVGIEGQRQDSKGYDKSVYLDRNFFGEDETRSYLAKLVTSRLSKIINVPCLKDHDAAGVTGCLKNIAYGSFNNVARSHKFPVTYTKTFIGDLANVEPLRSKTVLQIMDGLRGVYHGGPFASNQKYLWFPGLIYFSTDPVAIDRIELDVIEAKRKEIGVISLWDRSPDRLVEDNSWAQDPNKNAFIREPGHIEYAASVGLGVYNADKINHSRFTLA